MADFNKKVIGATFQTEDGYTFYLQPNGALTDSKNPNDDNADMAFDTLNSFMTEPGSDFVRAFEVILSNGYELQVTPDYEDDELHVSIFDEANEHCWTTDAVNLNGLIKLINEYAEI